MKYATGSGEFGTKLCEALGLEPRQVADIRIYVGTGAIAEVVVTYWMLEEEGNELVDLVKRYALVPHPEESAAAEPAVLPRLVQLEQPDV